MTLLALTQDITFWTIATTDGNNTPVWNAGIAVKGRWVRKDGIVRDVKGKDQKTEFIVYSTTLIPKRAMVVLDDLGGQALPESGARELMANWDNTSLSNLYKHVM